MACASGFAARGHTLVIALAFAFLALGHVASADPPRIDHLELFSTNQVTIHFNTEANHTYTLQFIDVLPTSPTLTTGGNGTVSGSWSNLFMAPNIPFADHYVIVDTRARPFRFYRLRITP